VVPVLSKENPRFAENVSATAMRLRLDEDALQDMAVMPDLLLVTDLRQKPAAIRYRILERYLKEHGVKEPEAEHLHLSDALLFSNRPSARVTLPEGVLLYRQYDRLMCGPAREAPQEQCLSCPGSTEFGEYQIKCKPANELINRADCFTVFVQGKLKVRSRQSGDEIRLSGGTKSLKKLYIDRKFPADERPFIPVLVDENGVVGVYGIGADLNHMATELPLWQISITKKKELPEDKNNVEQD
jgi:tRNA(Ile)-lysidine synthase